MIYHLVLFTCFVFLAVLSTRPSLVPTAVDRCRWRCRRTARQQSMMVRAALVASGREASRIIAFWPVRKRVSVSAELCASPGVAIALRFRDTWMCYEPRVANYRAAKSWEISPRAARSCHFSPPSPFLPPSSFPSVPYPFALPHYSRRAVFCRVYNRFYATATRFYRVIGRGFLSRLRRTRSSFIRISATVWKSSVIGVQRRKASKLRSEEEEEERRGGRRRWLDIVERAREGDQQRIRLTRHGRPRQNVSMSFPLFAFFISRCVAKSFAKKDTLVRGLNQTCSRDIDYLGAPWLIISVSTHICNIGFHALTIV